MVAKQPSISLKECTDSCLECHRVCLEMIQHCLKKGGRHADASHIGLLQNCAQICETSAQFMISESPFHQQTCGVCAAVCVSCAQSCDRLGDDEQMRLCAAACRRCADSCDQMSGGLLAA